MKGLERIPSIQDLELTYHSLQVSLLKGKQEVVQLNRLVVASQWTRFDPRLAEIWVRYIATHWDDLNPLEFHVELQTHPWPNSVGVLFEFVLKLIPQERQDLFLAWKNLILVNAHPAHFEQFFIGNRKLGGKLMLEDANYTLKEYLKWGYLSREVLFNKATNESFPTHSYDFDTRQKIARKLIDEHHRIFTKDYWNAIGQSISRRQAERDLRGFSFLQPRGQTKNRYFIKR